MNQNTLRTKLLRTRRWFKLRSIEQALYHELIFIAYAEKAEEAFHCPNYILCSNLHISEKSLIKARSRLVDAGLIGYSSQKKNKQAGIYWFDPAPDPVSFSEKPAMEESVVSSGNTVETPVKTPVSEQEKLQEESTDINNTGFIKKKNNKKGTGRETKTETPRERALAAFEKFYHSYPGPKRTMYTEFKDFIGKYDDYAKILPHLLPGVMRLTRWRRQQINLGRIVPEYKTIRSWLGQREWEYEHPNTYHYDD